RPDVAPQLLDGVLRDARAVHRAGVGREVDRGQLPGPQPRHPNLRFEVRRSRRVLLELEARDGYVLRILPGQRIHAHRLYAASAHLNEQNGDKASYRRGRMSLPSPYRQTAETWLSEDPDPTTATELRELLAAVDRGDAAAARDLRERFEGQLEFGTAGLRGILGAGPQRMNRVLVRKVSAGLAAYLKANVPDAAKRGVVIGHDARRNSRVFAEDTARVLAGAGLRVMLAHRP